jgi:uncharacterized protein (DUF58 family)
MTIVLTHRGKAYLVLVAFTATLALFIDYKLIVGFALLVSIFYAMKFHVEISTALVERLEVSSRASYTVEREPLIVEYTLFNRSKHSILWLEYSLEYESALALIEGAKAGLLVLPGRSTVTLRFVFKARTGTHWIGPFRVVVRDLLGLFRTKEFEVGSKVVVSIPPAIETALVRRLYAFTRSAGLVKTRSPGEGVEFYDVREYKPGDEPRRVVWRVFASRGELAVWEAEKETYQGLVYVIDSCKDMWTGPYNQSVFEHSARIVVSIARYVSKRGYAQSIILFDERRVLSSGKLSFGSQGVARVLETISRAEISSGEQAHCDDVWERVLKELISILPRERAFVFIFTRPGAKRWEGLLNLSLKLQSMGHGVCVVTPIITAYDLTPEMPSKLYSVYRAKQLSILREDLDGLLKLREAGINVISMTPQLVAQRIVQLIEARASI